MDVNKPTEAGGETQLPALRPEAPLRDSTLELWRSLSPDQKRFVLARIEHSTVAAACEKVGISRSLPYKWGPEVNEMIARLQDDQLLTAMDILSNSLIKAVDVKVQGLDADDERVRQAAASEIIDRYMGKAKQEVDLHHSGKVEATPITVYLPANHRDVTDAVDAEFDEDDV